MSIEVSNIDHLELVAGIIDAVSYTHLRAHETS